MLNIQKMIMLASLIAISGPNFSAAQAPNETQLQTFTKSDFYKGLMKRAIGGLPETVFKNCPTLVSNGSTISIVKPVSFAPSGFPNDGLWKQTFPIRGCGNDTILNFYFLAKADQKIDTIVGVAGTTNADIRLQNDAITYARIGAVVAVKNCEGSKFTVKNTKFEGFGLANPPTPDPGPGQRLRPWWETWTMTGCGRTVDVPMDFIPREVGTQIVQPGGVVER